MSPIIMPPTTGASTTLQIGRLTLGQPPSAWTEQVGDPVASLGGAVVPGARTPLTFQVALATCLGSGTSLAKGQQLRRQLRSLLSNTPLKLGGFIYVQYADDTEQNGWYVPSQDTLSAYDKASWKAVGLWQTQSGWLLAGHRRTHREARQIWMKDLRTLTYPRDILGWMRSTDFSALPALALTVLPNGATGAALTVSGQAISGAPLPTGRDGGQCSVVQGLSDLQVVSYERAESALNLSDVIVYDRRGQITSPTTGPDTSWEEVYGPDYPWNWTTGGATDCPVLDNGLVRVRWDSGNTPGFRVDAWNGTAYVEQGKMIVYRSGDTAGNCDTWISAGLHSENGYTPDRAIASVVMSRSADAYSHERVFVSVRRGEIGVTFECYPALKSAGGQADASFVWFPALNSGAADINISVMKSDTQTLPPAQGTGVIAATAGTGAQFTGAGAVLGASSFASSENYVACLRCPTAYNTVGAYQVTLTGVLASGLGAYYAGSDTAAYGTATNRFNLASIGGTGYVQVGLRFSTTASDQILESEAIRYASSTTATQVADATASGGQCVKDTQATAAANTLLKQTGLLLAKYRCFARVKCGSGSTGSIAGYLQSLSSGGTTVAFGTSAVAFTNTAWAWVDLGEALAPIASPWLTANLLQTAGTSGVFVDRLELFLVEERTRSGATFSGARDLGQSVLSQGQTLGAIVAR